MTRREALKGGSAAAVAAGAYLMQEQLVQAASAQTSEPRIQLGPDWVIDDDPDGSGHLSIDHTPNATEYTFQQDGELSPPSINPSNETRIRASRSTETSTTTSGTFVPLFDTEDTDRRGEYDAANNEIIPDRDGWYLSAVAVDWEGNSVDGDTCQVQIYDVTNDTTLYGPVNNHTGAGNPPYMVINELSAGTRYEFRGRNLDSSFTIGNQTRGNIVRLTA